MVSTWTTLQGSPIQPPSEELDLLLDVLIIVGSELPNSVLGVGIDEHGQEYLAFERLNVSDVLGHGAGEVVHRRVVGGETGSSSSSEPSFFHGWPASQHTTTCADVCLLRCEAGLFVSFGHGAGSGVAEAPCEPNTEHSMRRSALSPTAVFCIRSQAAYTGRSLAKLAHVLSAVWIGCCLDVPLRCHAKMFRGWHRRERSLYNEHIRPTSLRRRTRGSSVQCVRYRSCSSALRHPRMEPALRT